MFPDVSKETQSLDLRVCGEFRGLCLDTPFQTLLVVACCMTHTAQEKNSLRRLLFVPESYRTYVCTWLSSRDSRGVPGTNGEGLENRKQGTRMHMYAGREKERVHRAFLLRTRCIDLIDAFSILHLHMYTPACVSGVRFLGGNADISGSQYQTTRDPGGALCMGHGVV